MLQCFSEHAVRIGAGNVRADPRRRVFRIADKLQRIPMLDGLSFGVHPVDVDAGDACVVGVSPLCRPSVRAWCARLVGLSARTLDQIGKKDWNEGA